jgi:hypothetical protein
MREAPPHDQSPAVQQWRLLHGMLEEPVNLKE